MLSESNSYISYGIITEVIPPESQSNYNKLKHEYSVDIMVDLFSTIHLRNVVLADSFGSMDDYNYKVLHPGNRVIVSCMRGNPNESVIISCLNNSVKVMSGELGSFWEQRYNRVTQTIDKESSWQVKLDTGPNLKIEAKKITIDDSKGQKIVFDSDEESITIEAKDWQVTLRGDANIKVEGAANIDCQDDITISSESKILLANKAGGSPTEPFVLGNKLESLLRRILESISNHRHLGNLGSPTTDPINMTDFIGYSGELKDILSELTFGD